MFKRIVSSAAALAILASSSSFAVAAPKVAEVISSDGKVLVNRGVGYFPAESFSALSPGDKILVGAHSSAVIAYSVGGCSVTLSATSLMTVPAKAPCGKGEQVAMADAMVITPTMGGEATPFLFIFGAVLLGGVIFILLDDKDSSVSAP
jgi:hypothetical protein